MRILMIYAHPFYSALTWHLPLALRIQSAFLGVFEGKFKVKPL